MAELAAIPHVKIIRFHTRVPVADPARITREMVEALKVDGRDYMGRAACQSCARADG